jgi:PhzF family phenazine biosynthesis protein
MSPLPVEKKMNLYADEIQSALNMNGGTIDTALPIKFIDAGLATLLVPVKNLTEILRICPDIEVLKAFCLRSGIDIIEVFTNDVADPSNDFRTRVFAPTFGYLEDPATGSGNSALGYYLLSKNLFARDTIAIEQNGSKESFNRVKLRKKPDENGVARIWFGGGAVTRLAGDYFLY